MTHQVRDVNRLLEFEGTLLAHSSSWKAESPRWVEFFLYKTQSGSYVLSRVGLSLLYHRTTCGVATRNKLKLSDAAGLAKGSEKCPMCQPEAMGTVCAEEPRYWAQVCPDAQTVVESCWKYDEQGARYYTLVVRRLLDEASEKDKAIEGAYLVEYVE